MNRTITREITFTKDEVQEAMVLWLEKNSQAVPSIDASVEFEMAESDATMRWQERHQL